MNYHEYKNYYVNLSYLGFLISILFISMIGMILVIFYILCLPFTYSWKNKHKIAKFFKSNWDKANYIVDKNLKKGEKL
jgi:4-hydroxybenzoate polyprenyltransferase